MMQTYHNQGEGWYIDRSSLWSRVRRWIVWIGGWERALGGWSLTIESYGRKHLVSPAPVSLFGHRFTWYGWGWQVRAGRDWLVWVYPHHDRDRCVYLSPTGTPNDAWKWYAGAPSEVAEEALARLAAAEGKEARHD